MLRRAFRLRGLATAPPASRKVAVQFPYTKTPNSTDATSFAVAAGEEVELLEWGKPQWVRVRTASGEEGAMQLPVIPAPAADAAAGYVLEGYLDGGRPAAEAVLGQPVGPGHDELRREEQPENQRHMRGPLVAAMALPILYSVYSTLTQL